MKSELIIASYRKVRYLRVVINTLLSQTSLPDSICIADDGSGPNIKELIDQYRPLFNGCELRFLTHEDDGFRKNLILNAAIVTSSADYMIFIDDDCCLSPYFIECHLTLAQQDSFLTGSLIRMQKEISADIIRAGNIVWKGKRPVNWAPRSFGEFLKAHPFSSIVGRYLNNLSPIRKSWIGSNASVHKQNLLAVNGFDNDMGYGGCDKELGVRLINAGVRARTIRYSAPVYHLDHDRGYAKERIIRENREKIISARESKKVRTNNGIQELN